MGTTAFLTVATTFLGATAPVLASGLLRDACGHCPEDGEGGQHPQHPAPAAGAGEGFRQAIEAEGIQGKPPRAKSVAVATRRHRGTGWPAFLGGAAGEEHAVAIMRPVFGSILAGREGGCHQQKRRESGPNTVSDRTRAVRSVRSGGARAQWRRDLDQTLRERRSDGRWRGAWRGLPQASARADIGSTLCVARAGVPATDASIGRAPAGPVLAISDHQSGP
jgi:hypothetical protein